MKQSLHILVADHDATVSKVLERVLEKAGFRVSRAATAAQTKRILEASAIDLLVLENALPDQDGLSFCRELRERGFVTPIIMLTSDGDDIEKILGLEMGADDCLLRPFNTRELLARIKAVMRRANNAHAAIATPLPRVIEFAGWRLEPAARRLEARSGTAVALSTGEFDLLLTFLLHPQTVLTRDQLLDHTHGRNAVAYDRSIDVLVSRLRRKLGDDARKPEIIKTVWGGGYLFTPDVLRD